MKVSENNSGFLQDGLFRTAERENNAKRRNLLVNLRQAKHFPASPGEALGLFDRLGKRIAEALTKGNALSGGKTLVIAFAETATALGARAAGRIPGQVYFLHTTRENISREYLIADFSEEHSHASSQLLFCKSGKAVFDGVSDIVFIDDELTTGKTIINCVNEIAPFAKGCRFFAASLINGMNKENLKRFSDRGITPLWLVKTEDSEDVMECDLGVCPERDCEAKAADVRVIRETFPYDPRLGCFAGEYLNACGSLAEDIMGKISGELSCVLPGSEIAVIGTEECMLPSVILGRLLEERGYCVRCRSVTRSPIVPSRCEGYPLFSRYPIDSVYEQGRQVYLYNSLPCSLAVLVTDGTGLPALSETAGASLGEKCVGVILERGGENS